VLSRVAEHRGNSYAAETLHLSLILSRAVGTERVLVTCDHGDVGSTDGMRRNARIGRGQSSPTPRKRRYWID
jgi:predicted acetyltransferase